MGIAKDIKCGFKRNAPLTIWRLLIYPFVFVIFLVCAITIAICVGLFSVSVADGVDAFKEIMDLGF